MKSKLLFSLLVFPLLFFACSKTIDDRIVGSWQLESSWQKKFLGRDYFTTGYENGYFTFEENNNASYIEGLDTLNGYWRTGRRSNTYYNYDNGNWETREMKYLRISLVDFLQNRRLEWEFDEFDFRNDWSRIRAEYHSASVTKVYEFIRR